MLESLLKTKLFVPRPRPNLVPRPQLIEQLNQGLHLGRRLSLISAPAGFGKTTLVSEWVGHVERAAGWLALDEGDNEPARFVAYVVAALQTIADEHSLTGSFGEGVLGLLQSARPLPTEAILTALLNEIVTIPDPFVLVLDDYHVIDAQPVDDALTFLLEHLPPQMHLVIATREDPRLPLARMRVRGQLTELRVNDLRFSPSEAAEFLNETMGLYLSAGEVASLEARTEGWIAGLQMAALSMQGRADRATFIQAFAGSHRFVLDYLVEEVLRRQPEPVRQFLLQTSLLDRLNGPLCDAVRLGAGVASAAPEDGKHMLEALERDNLFVVPLDDQRQWYRYHHLFADVLRAHLMEEQPDQVAVLHRRASEWHEENGSTADAVHHALAGGDFARVADLAEVAWTTMHTNYVQSPTWFAWVKVLPDELIRERPVLSVGYAWSLLDRGELEAGEARLRDAERWMDDTPGRDGWRDAQATGMIVVNEEEFRSLPVTVAVARVYYSQALGDIPGTAKHARRVLDMLPDGEQQWRWAIGSLLGLAQWVEGDLAAARRTLVEVMAGMRNAGNIPDAIGVTFVLADIMTAQGRLREAKDAYEQSLQLASNLPGSLPLEAADVYRGLSELYCEWDDLDAAAHHLLTSTQLSTQGELPDWGRRLHVTEAGIKVAQGDLGGALDLLIDAERLTIRTPLPDVRPLAAMKTRLWLAQGKLPEAMGWARDNSLSADDELSYMREFEHITLAKVLIARYRSEGEGQVLGDALALLQRLLRAAEAGGRMGSVIEILMLQALAHESQGDISAALAPLERALQLAEPQGYVRLFANEGPPMAMLLQEMAGRGIAADHVRRLQAAMSESDAAVPASQPLVEPLSERELDVLRLLSSELSGPEIARELLVSLNTMRTHTKNIYSKLGVNSRRSAVRRAQELDLL